MYAVCGADDGVLAMYGVCIGCVWAMYQACMGDAWSMCGRYVWRMCMRDTYGVNVWWICVKDMYGGWRGYIWGYHNVHICVD